jgi:hypothetical protein
LEAAANHERAKRAQAERDLNHERALRRATEQKIEDLEGRIREMQATLHDALSQTNKPVIPNSRDPAATAPAATTRHTPRGPTQQNSADNNEFD